MDRRSAPLESVRVGRRWLTASRQCATCTAQAKPTHQTSLLLLALVTLNLTLFMNTCALVRCEGHKVDIAHMSKASTRPDVEPKADKASILNDKVHNEEEEDEDEKGVGLSAIKLDERIDSETAQDEIQEEAFLSTRLPRQQFRVNLVPNARSRAGPFKLITIQRRRAASDSSGSKQPNKPNVLKRSPQNKVDTSADEGDAIKRLQLKSRTTPTSLPAASTKKISSATLKKLLSQTLPSGMNGTSYSSANYKGPNFKLVFIQRAAKSPAANSSSLSIKRVAGNNQKQSQPSLAASVSKQLTNSLLYTAASNLMSHNFTGSTLIPSLSSLASLATSSGTTTTTASTSEQANIIYTRTDEPLALSSTTSSPQPSSRALDRKEGTSESAGKGQVTGSGSNDLGWSVTKTIRTNKSQSMNRIKRPRPSKIYNLPVKFVANGQPNGVMFQSIKQHFATIKRLQQQASGAGQEPTSGKGRRRLGTKTSSSAGQTRPKGTNSRLIYLPLKYLSNARPTKLSDVITTMARSTKASHKSSPSSKHTLS